MHLRQLVDTTNAVLFQHQPCNINPATWQQLTSYWLVASCTTSWLVLTPFVSS